MNETRIDSCPYRISRQTKNRRTPARDSFFKVSRCVNRHTGCARVLMTFYLRHRLMTIIMMIKRNDYSVYVPMWTGTLALYSVAILITYDLKRLSSISPSLTSLIDIPRLFSLSFSFAVVHYHYRRMTINNNNSNNSKSDSLPPPSLVPSFNHHRFVSFGPAASPIVDVAAVVFSSFSSFSMLQSYHYYCCH